MRVWGLSNQVFDRGQVIGRLGREEKAFQEREQYVQR